MSMSSIDFLFMNVIMLTDDLLLGVIPSCGWHKPLHLPQHGY